jgi:predicted nuclease with TOPRIM domain
MSQQNPYKGLFPYAAEDEKLFFGREKETLDLLAMIKINQLVVLYGDSGTGKTSLINAKLFPELKRLYYFPIYIRLNYTNKSDPLTQVRQIIYNELSKWDDKVPQFLPSLTLIEYAAKTSLFDGLVKPILFFDQFEELFTLGYKNVKGALLNEMISQLADLIEVRLPSLNKRLQLVSEERYRNEDVNEDTCTENVLRFTVVFSLRQDFLGQLDDLRVKIPSLSTNRYRIKKFTNAQAYAAIIKPAEEFAYASGFPNAVKIVDKETGIEIVNALIKLELTKNDYSIPKGRWKDLLKEKGILHAILGILSLLFKKKEIEGPKTKITDEENELNSDYAHTLGIDPTVLSLYCYQLYEEAKSELGTNESSLISLAQVRISPQQVQSSPGEKIIKNYYNVSLTNQRSKNSIETLLITPDGRRLLVPLDVFLGRSGLSENEVEDLRAKTGILRLYGKDKDRQIELAHDQIAKRALISKKAREANLIGRNTYIFLFITTLVVALSAISSLFYIREREKWVDIQYLQALSAKLTAQNISLNDSLSKFERNYNAVLASRKSLISENDKINEQINSLKVRLDSELRKNVTLAKTLSASNLQNQEISAENKRLQARYNSIVDSSRALRARLNQQTTELNSVLSRGTRLQNELTDQNKELVEVKRKVSVLEGENAKLTTELARLNRALKSTSPQKQEKQQQQQQQKQ